MKEKSILERLESAERASGNHFVALEDARKIAEESKSSLSKIYSVGTFYSMLSFKPRGKHIIRICNGLTCHLSGGKDVIETLKEILGINVGETTKDNLFTLEESSCLGLCSIAPAMMIDDTPYGNLTVKKIKEIINTVREGDKK
jgi:NADH-quinone oxidoreductase subunit E